MWLLSEAGMRARRKLEEWRATRQLLEQQEQDELRRQVAAKLLADELLYPTPSPATAPFYFRSSREPANSTALSPSSSRSTPFPSAGFLFPVRIGEQESKAQQHLQQLALLAISLNRTLVLPNVGSSRFTSCQLFPFPLFYDVEKLVAGFEGKLSVVGQEDWLRWFMQEKAKLRGAFVRIIEGRRVNDALVEEEDEEPPSLAKFCLGDYESFFDRNLGTTAVYAPPSYFRYDDHDRAAFSNGLVAHLFELSPSRPTAGLTSPPTDVLMVDYNLRHPIFPSFVPVSTPVVAHLDDTDDLAGDDPPPSDDLRVVEAEHRYSGSPIASFHPFPDLLPLASSPSAGPHAFLTFTPLPYAPLWTSLAESLSQRLSHSIGIHWRMETVPPDHLVPCAQSLAADVASLIEGAKAEGREIKSIYLASDYPVDNLLADTSAPHGHSDTFRSLTSSHHSAVSLLLSLLHSSPSSLPSSPPSIHTLSNLLSTQPSLLPPHLSAALQPLHGDLIALDPGLHAALDKLILQRAEWFVAGSGEKGAGQCGKLSSYTDAVLFERRRRMERDKEQAASDDQGSGGEREPVEVVRPGVHRKVEEDKVVRWFRIGSRTRRREWHA
ncbi:hypothetical protein JCM1840_001138 [Sporobolomyces johnsonii]